MTDFARYRRQITLIGAPAQEALGKAHVAVIGAGGLGSPALLYLAGAGVGQVTLIDDDTVELSNLHRQVIHKAESVGTSKVDSAKEAMLALNPTIRVSSVSERLTWDNAEGLLRGADIIVDGADNFSTRHIASHAAARLGIPHVWGSILGHEAQTTVFWAGHGPVYEDVFSAPPPAGSVPSCSQAGVLGPLVGIIGSTMAMEAIKLITEVGSSLLGKLGYYDGLTGTWEYIPLVSDPAVTEHILNNAPPSGDAPPQVVEVESIPEGAALIDVREPEEVAEYAIPGSVNVPLGRILDGHIPQECTTSTPVVFYCTAGIRSAQAVATLEREGITKLYSLRGGIDGWLDAQPHNSN